MSHRTICRVPGSSRGGERPRGRSKMVCAGVTGLLALVVSMTSVRAQGACGLNWAPGFGPRGTQGAVETVAVHDDGSGPALFVTGALSRAGAHPSLGIAKWSGMRPQLALSRPGGPGSGVVVQDLGLTAGTETFNVISFTPCPLGPGGGPCLGLCSLNLGDLVAQVLLPLGTVPFHFLAPNASVTFGPYPLPAGTTFEGICFAWTGTGFGCVSPVRSLVVQ